MKTLILDIETAPSMAYVWSFWKQNVGHDMVADYGGYIMSCSLKWLGSDDVIYLENRKENDKKIVTKICKYLDEADFVIAHNGKKFDIPFIKARAVINNVPPPSPYKVIDTLQIAKKEMMFKRNTLQYIAEALDVPLRKLDHARYPGFKLWLGCLNGEEGAWQEMKKYNIMDVEVLEQVYLRLRPWSSNHPNILLDQQLDSIACPRCGSYDVGKRGFYTTNKGKYQRYCCGNCGGWSSETYMINSIEDRKKLLASR